MFAFPSLVVWMLPLVAAAGQEQPSLDAFLTEFESKRAGVQSVQAAFVQDEISPDDSVRSEGTLCYIQPRRIVFRYVEPEIAYLVDGLRVYEYDAEFEQVQIFDLENDPEAEALFLGFGGDADRLQKAYDLSLAIATPDSCGTHVLTLRPKQPDEIPKELLEDDTVAGSLFEEARITLTAGDLLPCRIEIINDEESSIVINIVQYAVNKPLEDGADRLSLPEGTRVIENDTLTETVGKEGAVLPREAADSP